MKFIDLFCGLGGFHVALDRLGHKCVFASEIDPSLAAIYETNFGIRPHGDIRQNFAEVPEHDILCAGFPCQPFSKAGEQEGLNCVRFGDLFGYVVTVLKLRSPKFFILENVPNLLKHEGGKTLASMQRELQALGYQVRTAMLSPHHVGVPQIRDRLFIVGSREPLPKDILSKPVRPITRIRDILDHQPADARPLTPAQIAYIDVWQEFIELVSSREDIPSFPVWGMEFGADYPLDGPAPARMLLRDLAHHKGALGSPVSGRTKKEALGHLPPYARADQARFPVWKRQFITQNREFYRRNEDLLADWRERLRGIPPSFQKLEWNWKGGPPDLWNSLIQFRASGIRAKRPDAAPSLVALTTSQVPIVTWERRYMTVRECARLQSLDGLPTLPPSQTAGFKALGNAVNAKVAGVVASALIDGVDLLSEMQKAA